MSKRAVAMSGGVDSSVAAALMVEKYGRDAVFGVTMRLFCYTEGPERQSKENLNKEPCCSLEAVNDAKLVCNQLGIPHYALSLEKEFEEVVIQNFIQEYKAGRTPIPCVLCNTVIKFESLLKKVQELGAEILVTGHYARITPSCHSDRAERVEESKRSFGGVQLEHSREAQDDNYRLLKGVDETKDQSYFLYGLNQEQLAHTLFPLGNIKKTQVRKLAAKFNLKTAKKKESQGICFIQSADKRGCNGRQINADKYRVTDWLADKIKIRPGKIKNTKGEVLGEHEGIIFYTIGQRKRIGGGYAEPMYVVGIKQKENEVIIGSKEELYGKKLTAKRVNWISGIEPKLPKKCSAKIRYNMADQKCTIFECQNKNVKCQKVVFNELQRAITPGQSIVFYEDDIVLGGGVIASL